VFHDPPEAGYQPVWYLPLRKVESLPLWLGLHSRLSTSSRLKPGKITVRSSNAGVSVYNDQYIFYRVQKGEVAGSQYTTNAQSELT